MLLPSGWHWSASVRKAPLGNAGALAMASLYLAPADLVCTATQIMIIDDNGTNTNENNDDDDDDDNNNNNK